MARVRFAPSPTGLLHLGGLRTALFNYLLAKKTGGQLILRIEDTDRKRTVPNAITNLITTFDRLGIIFDEGPHVSGPCGPYIQSHRLELYRSHIQQLVECGAAYPCFCSKERLQSLAKERRQSGGMAQYDGLCRRLPRLLALDKMSHGHTHTIRLQVEEGSTVVEDLVYGSVTFDNATISDQVLLKSDGFPTYHLASVVDDHLMGVSHVLRGEEWLPSTPKHVLLYRALGWAPPVFVHLPLLLSMMEGERKLSKRNDSASVEASLDAGYLPSALLNFVALLGWAPQGKQEIFSLQELVQAFSLDQLNRASVKVDMGRLKWINAQHFEKSWRTQAGRSAVVKALREEVEKCYGAKVTAGAAGILFSLDYVEKVADLMHERYPLLPEMAQNSDHFFVDPTLTRGEAPASLVHCMSAIFSELESSAWDEEAISSAMERVAIQCNVGKSRVLAVLRTALTGNKPGPPVAGVAAVLGQERTLQRLHTLLH